MWCLVVLATLWALAVPTHCAATPVPVPVPAPVPAEANPPVVTSGAVASGATSRGLQWSYGGIASYAGYVYDGAHGRYYG